jgi:hypothetical protein
MGEGEVIVKKIKTRDSPSELMSWMGTWPDFEKVTKELAEKLKSVLSEDYNVSWKYDRWDGGHVNVYVEGTEDIEDTRFAHFLVGAGIYSYPSYEIKGHNSVKGQWKAAADIEGPAMKVEILGLPKPFNGIATGVLNDFSIKYKMPVYQEVQGNLFELRKKEDPDVYVWKQIKLEIE